ncbi:polyketide cyclase [Paramesorhizobium deserti]|uniref:Polyketide cyclase n=1 Tax=Paramesorhizobium deserti TaxID=1494590 RepID=A0A135HXP8_9HYPH|nr:SRPBCC family protein [Paramesorhizobium deserti]KXF77986.1 polyketide cyclase [Paramesorhizobium deserti]
MSQSFNPNLDLTISRIIKAPRAAVWNAWTNPASLAQWWIPAPAKCRVAKLDLHPGGAFVTEMSEDGDFMPHLDACFLDIREGERLVFTNALIGGWRPAEQPFITAVISFRDHPDGTDYLAHVMHKNNVDRNRHEELGFYDGWGTVVGQLAQFVERP